MLRKIGSLFFILLLLPLISVANDDISLTLKIDSESVSLGEVLSLEVELSGARDFDEVPTIHSNGKFELRSNGTTSHMEIINGDVNVKKIFAFTTFPKEKGSFTIGPARIVVGGKSYSSNSVVVTVSEGSALPKQQRLVFCEATVDNLHPYINQQIVYTFKFYSRASTQDASLNLPNFSQFWVEEDTSNTSNRRGNATHKEVVLNGVPWNVSEIQKVIFPTKTGKISLDPATLDLSILLKREGGRSRSLLSAFLGEDYSAKQMSLSTKSFELDVKPLPLSSDGIETKLVGIFVAKSALSKSSVKQGESLTYTVTIGGDGNVRDINPPALHLPATLKIYEDRPETNLNVTNGKVSGVKIFKYAIVPQEMGEFEFPQVDVTYFNPVTNSYETSTAAKIKINVEKGELSNLNHATPEIVEKKKDVEILGKDLMSIKREVYPFASPILGKHQSVISFSISIIMLLIYFALLVFKRRSDKRSSSGVQLRKDRAFKVFKASVAKIDAKKDSFQEISKCLRIYIGDKLSIDGSALSVSDLPGKLPMISPENFRKVEDILKRCEMGSYGGVANKVTKDELISIVKQLDKEFE